MQKILITFDWNRALCTFPTIYNVANLLVEIGHKVCVLMPTDLKPNVALTAEISRFKKTFPQVIAIFKALLFKARKYNLIICCNGHELIAVGAINLIYRIPFIYVSLEIYDPKDAATLKSKFKRSVENYFIRRSTYTIVQDEMRGRWLSEISGLDRKLIGYVPNSYIGIVRSRGDLIRRKLGIPIEKTIILYAGSIEKWAVDDSLIEAVKAWTDNFVLVLHGWSRDGYLKHLTPLIRMVNSKMQKIYVSQEFLNDEDYETYVSSANIGLCWYKGDAEPNVKKMGLSSGKLNAFLHTGIPVIVPGYMDGMADIVAEYGAGVVVQDEWNILSGANRLVENWPKYRENAFKLYKDKLEFGKNFFRVWDKINALCYEDFDVTNKSRDGAWI